MNPEILEKVLACPQLPSLPAVGLRVIELTQDRNVNIKDLAETITSDQALAAKILRTVNSSFYALRRPCSTINQAIVLLGLTAVKTLALGFTLVSAISRNKAEGFDYQDYWRRGLLTGIAAKHIAKAGGVGNEEECFLGGLLQDIGVLALYTALGDTYAAVLRNAAGDHRRLVKLELDSLETQHPDIGAMIASRWKLPESLVMPIKYHERPTAAPSTCAGIVAAVALGNIAADVLCSPEPAGPLTRFYSKAEQWLRLKPAQADETLRQASAAASEVARLFQIDAGTGPDAEAVLAQARQRLLSMSIADEDPPADVAGSIEETDPVTLLPARVRFDRTLIAAFEQSKAGAGPLALALFDADQLAAINAGHSNSTGDAVIRQLGDRLCDVFQPVGATVFRFEEDTIAVLLPRTDLVSATRLAELARRRIHGGPMVFPPGRCPVSSLTVSASVGLACMDDATAARFSSPSELVAYATQALAAAKSAGRNTLRVYAPAAAA